SDPALASEIRPEVLPEKVPDLVAADRMILRAARSHLDRAQEGGEPSRLVPIEARRDAMEQAGPVRVAAAGRIDDRWRLGAGNVESGSVREDDRALRAAGEDQGLEVLCKILELASGPILEKAGLVIVHRHVGRLLDEGEQLL